MYRERIRTAVRQLQELTTGCIDASTIIYTQKAGFLGLIAETVELVSTQPVIAEVGELEVHIAPAEGHTGARYSDVSPDESLLAAAGELGIPVLSEDRRVLGSAKAAGLPCFNAAMLLNFLVLRDRVSSCEFAAYRQRLFELAWYSEHIRRFADACCEVIVSSRQFKHGGLL